MYSVKRARCDCMWLYFMCIGRVSNMLTYSLASLADQAHTPFQQMSVTPCGY